MSAGRLFAIILIYLSACGAWAVLGTATLVRSDSFSERLAEDVARLWGRPLVQAPPSFVRTVVRTPPPPAEAPGGVLPPLAVASEHSEPLLPTGNAITVRLERDLRRKGLLWYPTYRCAFSGTWTLADAEGGMVEAQLALPDADATYEDVVITLDGVAQPLAVADGTVTVRIDLIANQPRSLHVAYVTRGLGEWRYRMASGALGRVRGLSLDVTTDFTAVDYPDGTISPMAAEPDGDGLHLHWATGDLLTRRDIGVVVPGRLNPGPVASRIIFFAPVCLLFFVVMLATIAIVRRLDIHPMHYLFVAAGFFAFHLLLAYLVDQLDLQLAFAIAAVVAVGLVTSYLRAALGARLPVAAAVAAQLFFLVLFSYSFLLPGVTGLTVAIGSVATLAVLMAVTARLDWREVFARRPQRPTTPAQPSQPPG